MADDTANNTNPSILNDTIEIIRDQRPSKVLQLTDHRDEATNYLLGNENCFIKLFRNILRRSLPDFSIMFPNKPTCKDFTLASSKLSYIDSDSVRPHFREIFLTEVKNSTAQL